MSKAKKTAAVAIPFQPDALEIEERPASGHVRLALYLVIGLIASAGVWASLASIDRVIVSDGRLITTAPPIEIKPHQTAAVQAVEAAVGDIVRAGQVLVRLDPTVSRANVAQLRRRLAVLSIETERLRAEIESRDFPFRRLASSDLDVVLQQQIFDQGKVEFVATLRAYEQQMKHLQAIIETSLRSRRIVARQVAVIDELSDMHEELHDRKLGRRSEALRTRSQKVALEREHDELGRIAEEKQFEIRQMAAEREAFIQSWRKGRAEALRDKLTMIEQLTEELTKADNAESLAILSAPRDAVVLKTSSRAMGSTAMEGEPLVTLVPLNDPLEAEVVVRAMDIARIQVGDPVRIKLAAMPFQRHGAIHGEVRSISEDAFENGANSGAGSDFDYRVRVRLLDTALEDTPEGFRFLPGMTLQGEVRVGRRTVISYFLYPVLRMFDEGLREP
ncbi:MAG: HlyD family type I secretion periplasmic adaptor subunit [Alphaproteobacteria bacterium]|nr:HlyD family type I secretion periplasmic adaptor subunit [Alphaproteobacteria bacterium]